MRKPSLESNLTLSHIACGFDCNQNETGTHMTNEERDLITQFIERIAAPPARQAGSVPYTLPVAAQPVMDREADALIADLMLRHPEARYRLTQTAFVQEHALAAAQNTINRLQWELDQARTQSAPMPAASPWGAPPQQPRSLFGGLFGGRQAPPQAQNTPPPAPVHAPGYQPGMFQQGGGSSFLGSALTTAAGVAGGMVVGNMLMNAFSGHGNAAQAANSGAGGTPWTNATSAPEDSGWQQATPTSYQDPGQDDQADSGWSDAGGDDEV